MPGLLPQNRTEHQREIKKNWVLACFGCLESTEGPQGGMGTGGLRPIGCLLLVRLENL